VTAEEPTGKPKRGVKKPEPPPPLAPPEPERKLYANVSALLAFHGRSAQYEIERGDMLKQSVGGGGYELVGMLGSTRKGFAFGGAASFLYVPKTLYRWEGEELEGLEAYDPSVWALSLGPAVDYHPGRYFHVGGLFGLALENVPSFEHLPTDRETVPGLAQAVWLGFEWSVDEALHLGVVMTGHLRQSFHRDIEVARSRDNSEMSVSLGLGVNLSHF
jgi:hypothetical protein